MSDMAMLDRAGPDPTTSGPKAADAALAERPPQAPKIRPNGPIVPAADVAIWSEARDAMAAATRYAASTRSWAQEVREEERQRGYAEGWAAGAEEAARLVAETAIRATAHLDTLEHELPALVHGIVAEILGNFDAGELIARSVRRAVSTLQPDAVATLHVAPGDVDAVAAALTEINDRAALRIEADPAVEPGEGSLRSALGSIELGVAAQLRALKAGLGAEPSPDAGDAVAPVSVEAAR